VGKDRSALQKRGMSSKWYTIAHRRREPYQKKNKQKTTAGTDRWVGQNGPFLGTLGMMMTIEDAPQENTECRWPSCFASLCELDSLVDAFVPQDVLWIDLVLVVDDELSVGLSQLFAIS